MKVYIVFESILEDYVFNVDGIFKGIHLKEEDAIEQMEELSDNHNCIYYEEVIVE